ncbi:nucleoporin complex subunit 54-domain-containing protein [Lipomyces tetrasporus]|uniref:Nucleoporin complex subunit 54-domain-containing protein n=1 Tax=Lipomyces tetrasporus TaxID=54092 RepID=A0AAD7QSW8_9ASCO|nr:nucleoporin complex subunit 54-domain-containing protein [Lipomyces tetrasporus]KAJ8100873.1 nucleoporin complex subunit 54-domain-containing protein [Lipomyces tetrasporus]
MAFTFGQPQQAQQQQSLFGSSTTFNPSQSQQQPFSLSSSKSFNPSASTLGSSAFGQSVNQPGLVGNLSQSVVGLPYGPISTAPSIPDQLQKIKNSWDPSSPECAFQFYFYNKVPSEHALLYSKPPNHDQTRWEAAIAARPDSGSVPVLAVGFTDLQKRVNIQHQQVTSYQVCLHEINTRLTKLITRHDLYTTVKIAELKARHAGLAHRTMSLAAKIQVLKSRGYALRPDEEMLKRKFEELTRVLNDPAVFGKINEVWARMMVVRDRIKILNEQMRQTGEQWENAIDWEKDEEQLEKLARILKGQQAGLIYLADVLRKDMEEVDQIIRHLEEKRMNEDERARGKR